MGIIIKYIDPHVDMKNNNIPLIFYVTACIGSLMILCAAQIIARLFSTKGIQSILYIGQNSLIIMCIHEPLKRIILVIVSKLCNIPTDALRENLIYSIVVTFIILLACLPFIHLINNYIPWIIGKKFPTKRISDIQ